MDTVQRLRTFIVRTYLKDETRVIGDDEPLISSGIIDSFGLVDLSLFIETEFGVALDAPELTMEHADTVRQFAQLIELRR